MQTLQQGVLVWLVVAVLGLLNPLACIVHCQRAQMAAARTPWGLSLCGHPTDLTAGADGETPAIPRVFFDQLAVHIPVWGTCLWLLGLLARTASQRPRDPFWCPPVPPPRQSRCSMLV